MTKKIDTVLKAVTNGIVGALPSDTVKNPKLNVNSTYPVFFARSYPIKDPQFSTQIHGSINTITIHQSNPRNDKPEEKEQEKKDGSKNINTNPSPPPDPSDDDSHIKEPEVGENAGTRESEVEYFD
ncbi:hypothetical protein Tco_0930251, partial [Tanacetum coccineum]